MKLFFTSLILLLLASCGEESTRLKVPDTFKGNGMSFLAYQKYCGPQNLYNKENFSKIKNSKIKWKGTVYSVVNDDSSNNYANKTIKIKMDNSSSILSDVILRMPKGSESKIAKLLKGDRVHFIGKISYIGSKLNDHVVRVTDYRFVRPKKKK